VGRARSLQSTPYGTEVLLPDSDDIADDLDGIGWETLKNEKAPYRASQTIRTIHTLSDSRRWMDQVGSSVTKSIVLLLYFLLISGYRSSPIDVDHVRVDDEWVLDGVDRYQSIDLPSLTYHNRPVDYCHQNLNDVLNCHRWAKSMRQMAMSS
jgi:hypothetical protein